jgi:hypothetical protein
MKNYMPPWAPWPPVANNGAIARFMKKIKYRVKQGPLTRKIFTKDPKIRLIL